MKEPKRTIVAGMGRPVSIIHIPVLDDIVPSQDTIETIKACLAIREEVFVIGQGVPREIDQDDLEWRCGHLLLSADGVPAGTLRYRGTERGTKLERIAVLSSARGNGYGKRLVEEAIRIIRTADPSILVYIHAQLASEGFYRRLGFVDDGSQVFQEAGIWHRTMVMPEKENRNNGSR
jgi:predicted GNAT family N-acyltransferase